VSEQLTDNKKPKPELLITEEDKVAPHVFVDPPKVYNVFELPIVFDEARFEPVVVVVDDVNWTKVIVQVEGSVEFIYKLTATPLIVAPAGMLKPKTPKER
jgi:hypothetical protein